MTSRLPRLLSAACLSAGLALLLSGCWIPEHYISRIKIERDGTYKLYAEGTAVHSDTAYALRSLEFEIQSGKLKGEEIKKRKDETEGRIKKDLEQAAHDPRILGISSIGEGRARFTLSVSGNINGGELVFREREAPLSYAQGPERTLRVRVKDAVVTKEAENLGVKTDGDLSVVLAEGVEVLEHNAQKVPNTPTGAYRWHVGNADDPAPYLRIRLPEQASGTPASEKRLAHH